MPVDQSKRVLVVEDDAETRGMLSSLLSCVGLSVDAVGDGQEALAMLAGNSYSVILLDLLLPVLDGFGVLAALRESLSRTTPVVIVLTGAEPEVYASLDASIVHGIVRKPFDPGELAALVRSCAEIRSRSALGTMAIAAMIAGTPFITLLSKM